MLSQNYKLHGYIKAHYAVCWPEKNEAFVASKKGDQNR